MNNFDRNTRTLIVSFLVAIFALIPLRFIEAGEQQNFVSDSQVLGETISVPVETEDVVKSKLEAPYNELESCLSNEELKAMEDDVLSQIQAGGLSNDQTADILNTLRESEEKVCK